MTYTPGEIYEYWSYTYAGIGGKCFFEPEFQTGVKHQYSDGVNAIVSSCDSPCDRTDQIDGWDYNTAGGPIFASRVFTGHGDYKGEVRFELRRVPAR
jgi:hypothetical protein